MHHWHLQHVPIASAMSPSLLVRPHRPKYVTDASDTFLTPRTCSRRLNHVHIASNPSPSPKMCHWRLHRTVSLTPLAPQIRPHHLNHALDDSLTPWTHPQHPQHLNAPPKPVGILRSFCGLTHTRRCGYGYRLGSTSRGNIHDKP